MTLHEKAAVMRNAIDRMELALMGFGDLVDLPDLFEDTTPDVELSVRVTVGQMREACTKQEGVECSVFRNEAPVRYKSSVLIRQADAVADFCWPGERHYTKVNPQAVGSGCPGFCFMAARWKRCGTTKGGLLIFERRARVK